jgi:hypothetical protein
VIKAIAYATIAVFLGLVMTLIPAWVFLAGTSRSYSGFAAELSSGRIPLLTPDEDSDNEIVTPQWLGITGASFVVASVIYVLFRRETLNPFARVSSH